MIFILANPRAVTVAAGLVFMVASVGVGLGLFIGQRVLPRQRLLDERARHFERLDDIRREVRQDRSNQVLDLARQDPDPDRLISVAMSSRLWERRRADDDFLQVRVGLGSVSPRMSLQARLDDDGTRGLDPVCVAENHRVVTAQEAIAGQPLTLDLGRTGVASVCGDLPRARSWLRALVAEAVTLHGPDDLRVAAAFATTGLGDWDWLKWLPHSAVDNASSSITRLLAPSVAELDELIAQALPVSEDGEKPHLVVIIDADKMPSHFGLTLHESVDAAGRTGATVIYLVGSRRLEPPVVDARVTVAADGRAQLELPRPEPVREFLADELSVARTVGLARTLAPRTLGDDAGQPAGVGESFADLLAIESLEQLDTKVAWSPRGVRNELRVPIGTTTRGGPLVLDLKEPAFPGGLGPHGLVVGATGSGKSELLRTLVMALAVTHHPDRLALVLIDYKGDAAFPNFERLPHVAGKITNLEANPELIDRARAALDGERTRRQQVLKDAGDPPNVHVYNQWRDQGRTTVEGKPLPPLPSLVVVVDEMAELLTAKPDFADLFGAIARVGRSIGMHLLLASQKLEGGRIRGIESHLGYRIALKTGDPADSREAIGSTDAFSLPANVPGSAYLRVDTSVFERFRTALISKPPESHGGGADEDSNHPHLFSSHQSPRHDADGDQTNGEEEPDRLERSVLAILLDRLAAVPHRVHQVWRTPLSDCVALGELLPPLAEERPRGLTITSGEEPEELPEEFHLPIEVGELRGGLLIPVGIEDRPKDQRKDVLLVDLAERDTNLAVVGAQQSGKTTLLRSFVLSAAVTHTPQELGFYLLDFSGGLTSLHGLPHVGDIAGGTDLEHATRLLGEVVGQVALRQQRFADQRIDIERVRRDCRDGGGLLDFDCADIVLVIDDWSGWRGVLADVDELILDLLTRGPRYGIHVVLTAAAWSELRAPILLATRGRLELRINDPFDSRINRKAQEAIARGNAGRGVSPEEHAFQVALPRLEGGGIYDDLEALEHAVQRIATAWRGPRMPRIESVPPIITLADLPGPGFDHETGVPIGKSVSDLHPIYVDVMGQDNHFVALGDRDSGKTTCLRTVIAGLIARHEPDDLQIALFDRKRQLLDFVPEPFLLHRAAMLDEVEGGVYAIVNELRERLPGRDVSAAELQQRSWWSGPEIIVVIDDYDMLASRRDSPFEPFLFADAAYFRSFNTSYAGGDVELLPLAREVGLHFVVAHPTTGMSRGVNEPVLQHLLQQGPTGVVLSGDRSEGPVLHGVVPQQQTRLRGVFAKRGSRPERMQLAVV